MTKTTTRLQGWGEVEGIKVSDLRVGMRRVYNFGITAEIVALNPSKSGKTIAVRTLENGKEYTRQMKIDTVVVAYEANA